MVIGKSLPNTLTGIFLLKAEIASICMKDGELPLLTQPMMTQKNTSEILKKQPNS